MQTPTHLVTFNTGMLTEPSRACTQMPPHGKRLVGINRMTYYNTLEIVLKESTKAKDFKFDTANDVSMLLA